MASRSTRTALLTHFGHWVQPQRRQAQAQRPSRAGCRCPSCSMRRWSRPCGAGAWSRVQHRVVFGTLERGRAGAGGVRLADQHGVYRAPQPDHPSACGRVGRRVTTLCKGEDGLRQQLACTRSTIISVLPHASLRQPLPQPEPTNGHGLSQAVAAADASDGGGADGSRLDPARGAAVSRAAVATAAGAVRGR